MELVREFLSLESIRRISEENRMGKIIESYLFFSPDSFTNKQYAKAVALSLVCKNACLSCPDCIKILEDVHPDVLSFPKGKSLAVSDSKQIIEEVTKKPMLVDTKVIIINDIDNSSEEAQNKLLKIIEEPPKNVVFIATATNMDNVLQTIKSRMQKRQIEGFSNEQIERILEKSESEYKELAIIKGEGYIGKVLETMEDKEFFENYQKAKRLVFDLKSSPQILEYSFDKNMTRDSLKSILLNMTEFYRDILIAKTGRIDSVKNFFEKKSYESVLGEFSERALVQIQKEILGAIKKIQANCNASLILETLLVKILEVKYICK